MDHEALHAISAASCYFIPVRSKYSQLPVLRKPTVCACSSLSVGDKFYICTIQQAELWCIHF